MHISTLILGSIPALAAAHNQAFPKIVGGSSVLSQLKSRNVFSGLEHSGDALAERTPSVERRDGNCGPTLGACPTGQCCSEEG
jgi:hypothetical protein